MAIWKLLIFLIPCLSFGVASPYEDFIKRCVLKNDDGNCDMPCYNFTGSLNDFEYDDCRNVSMIKYSQVVVNITVYPPNAAAYREHFEREVRELFATRAEIETTEEELEKLAEEYSRNAEDHTSKRKWEIAFNFTLFLRECDSCPQGWDYIYDILHSREASAHRPQESSSIWTWILLVAAILCLVAVVGIVTANRKRNLETVSRRTRLAYCTGTWQLPKEEQPAPKRKKGLSYRNTNLQQSHFSNPFTAKEANFQRTSTPHDLYSQLEKIPPAPRFAPPPVNHGTLPTSTMKKDISAVYQPSEQPKLIDLITLSWITEEEIIERIRQKARTGSLQLELENQDEQDHSTPLLVAVKKCWRRAADYLIHLGADVHKMTAMQTSSTSAPSYSTVLHHSIHNGDVEMLRMLLTKYRSKFQEDLEGRKAINAIAAEKTPLMLCAFSIRHGAAMAKILIEAGADIADMGETDSIDPKYRTVLHYAAANQNVELLKYLLEVIKVKKKENLIDKQDFQYYTALWYAVNNVNAECVKLLLDAGAEQHTGQEKEVHARTKALAMADPEILKLLDDAIEKKRFGGARSRTKRKSKGSSSGYGTGEENEPLSPEDGEVFSPAFSQSHQVVNEESAERNIVINHYQYESSHGGLMFSVDNVGTLFYGNHFQDISQNHYSIV